MQKALNSSNSFPVMYFILYVSNITLFSIFLFLFFIIFKSVKVSLNLLIHFPLF